MITVLLTSCVMLCMSWTAFRISAWRNNFKLGKSAGFPIFYSPAHMSDVWWLLLYPRITPLIKLLPRWTWHPWLPLTQIFNTWQNGHAPFEETGSDTIFLATPTKNMIWTCDPIVVKQIFTLSTFQNPTNMVKFWDVFGPIIRTVEGDEWKNHRKILTYGLNSDLLPNVWKASIYQTQTLIHKWKEDDLVVPVMRTWTSRLSFHVLASAVFDISMDWGDYTPTADRQNSLEMAIYTVLKHLGLIFITPRALLASLPVRKFKEAHTALKDLTKYLKEIHAHTLESIDKISAKPRKNMLESVVHAGSDEAGRLGHKPLPENSVLGNIFFTMVAGHESTGNTLAFAFLLFAIYPNHQANVQEQLDRVLGSRPASEWNSDTDYNALSKGYLGAVLKDAVRIYNPTNYITRVSIAPTTITDSAGKSHTIPLDTLCVMDFPALLQNPKIFPPRTEISLVRREELNHSKAIDFDPLRWLPGGACEGLAPDGYVPFGLGPRHCPGKAFAYVEMIGVFATLLKEWDIQLVVDEEVLRECGGDREKAWERTRDGAMRLMGDGIEANLTIQLLKKLPIKLAKRSAGEKVYEKS